MPDASNRFGLLETRGISQTLGTSLHQKTPHRAGIAAGLKFDFSPLAPQRSLSSKPKSVDHTVNSFALSVILVWVSHTVMFNHLAESIQTQYATIHGLPFVADGKPVIIHQFYNRILFPAVFVFAANNLRGWTDVQLFLFLRFLSFIICFLTIFIAMTRRSDATMHGLDCRLFCPAVTQAFAIRTAVLVAWLARHLSLEGFARWRLRRHTPEPPQPESALTMGVQNRSEDLIVVRKRISASSRSSDRMSG